MNKNHINDFVNRDWPQIAESDQSHWASEHKKQGFTATLNASMILWQHMKQVRPDWPSTQERQADIDNHIQLKQLLDRNQNVLPAGTSLQRS